MSGRKAKRGPKRFLKPPPRYKTEFDEEPKKSEQKKKTAENKGGKSTSDAGKSKDSKTKKNVTNQNKDAQSSTSDGKKSISSEFQDIDSNGAAAGIAEKPIHIKGSLDENPRESLKLKFFATDAALLTQKLKNLTVADVLNSQNAASEPIKLIGPSTEIQSGIKKRDSLKSENFAQPSVDDSQSKHAGRIAHCQPAKPEKKSPHRNPGENADHQENSTTNEPSPGRGQDQIELKIPKTSPSCSSNKTSDSNNSNNKKQNPMADANIPKGAIPKRHVARTPRPPQHNRAEQNEPIIIPDQDFHESNFDPEIQFGFNKPAIIFCMNPDDNDIIPVTVAADSENAAAASMNLVAPVLQHLNFLASQRDLTPPPSRKCSYLNRSQGKKSPETEFWTRAHKYRGDFDKSRLCNRHMAQMNVSSRETQTIPRMQSQGHQVDLHCSGDSNSRQFEYRPIVNCAGDGGGDYNKVLGNERVVDPVEDQHVRKFSRKAVQMALGHPLAIPEDYQALRIHSNNESETSDETVRAQRLRVKRIFGKRCPCKSVTQTKTIFNPDRFGSRSLFEALRQMHDSSDRLMPNRPDVDCNRDMVPAEQLQREELTSLEEQEKMVERAERMLSRMEAELGISVSSDDSDTHSLYTQFDSNYYDNLSTASTCSGRPTDDEANMSCHEIGFINAHREQKAIVVLYDPEEYFANQDYENENQDSQNRSATDHQQGNNTDQNLSKKNRGKKGDDGA